MAKTEGHFSEKLKGLFTGEVGARLFMGGLFAILLALFCHLTAVRVDFLEINDIAKKYVVAQVDFEFPDEADTEVLRKESLRDLSTIYQVDKDEIEKRRDQFEDYLTSHSNWRQITPGNTFRDIKNGADAVKEILLSAHLTDARTFRTVKQTGSDVSDYYVIDVEKGSQEISFPERFWSSVQSKVLKKGKIEEVCVIYIINYLKQFRWKIKEDFQTARECRFVLEKKIPNRYTQVKAGDRVINQKEKVTARHIAMLQAMKKEMAKERNLWQPFTVMGSLIIGFLITAIGGLYLRLYHKEIFSSLRKLSLYLALIVLTLGFAKLGEYGLLHGTTDLIEKVNYPIIVPFATILIYVLIGRELALFSTFVIAVLMGLVLAFDHSRCLIINLISGLASILFVRRLRKRKEVFSICLKVWLISLPVIWAFQLLENRLWSFSLAIDALSTMGCVLLIALFVVSLLPLLEALFDVMTDITLVEYMDPNNELLRRLSFEAPGTYQHSLVVGSLAEGAALAIGANSLFCRVSALYHDIGKLFNPHYFTENQMGGFNIHQLLTPVESAQVIIAHVPEGESLAYKHGLPKTFIDIILEHHGTTLVYFFYAKEVEQMGGDVDRVDEAKFRYPGPKPRSKESAIMMIADTVEAASRSLDEVSEESLTRLVDKLVGEKAEEGQLDECQLTFEELGIVKRSIVKTLSVAGHLRVKYPEKKPVEGS